MTTLFNYAEGKKLQEMGISRAASFPWNEPVARARDIAIMLAKRKGAVCADDVHEYLSERLPDVLEQIQPAAWGAILRSPKLKFSGEIVESKRMARHCGTQRKWLYVA